MNISSWWISVLCFLSALAGAVASAATPTVGPNINLSRAPGNQYETAVAINPKNNNQIFIVGRNEIGGLSTAQSIDGGLSWTSKIIARSTLPAPGDVPRAYGNASAAWDDFGNLFLVYLSQGSTTSATYVTLAVSTDGGLTFRSPTGVGAAILLPNNNSPIFGDQPTVTVGPGSGGFPGSVWVTYWTLGGIAVSGASVSGTGVVGSFSTQTVPQPPAVNFGDIAVGPNGEVVVTYGPDSGVGGTIYTNVDPDGLGPAPFSTYSAAVAVNLGGFYYIPPQPNWGIDPEAGLAYDRGNGAYRGRLYLVYTDAPSVGSTDTNIFVIHSDDQGATWSTPVRVNDDAGVNSQFLPHISLDQTTGMVAVTWYDARNSAVNDTAQYFGAISSDGGATFGANFQISSGTSNQTNSVAALKKTDYGDYTGNAFVNGRLVPAWADNSNSTADNPDGATEFDIYTSIVDVPVVAACSGTNAVETAYVPRNPGFIVVNGGLNLLDHLWTSNLNPSNTTFLGGLMNWYQTGLILDYTGTVDPNGCILTHLTVKPRVTIDTSSLPNATAGLAYAAPIAVSWGVPPYNTTVSGLPMGLMFNGANVIGTPMVVGSFNINITAIDSVGVTAAKTLTLTVVDQAIAFAPVLPGGTVGSAYAATLSATGFGPFTYSATGLPQGLSLGGNMISGTPTAAGTYTGTLTATDATGATSTVGFTLTINPAPGNYTIPDEGKSKITALGAGYLMIGKKKLIWNATTKIVVHTPAGDLNVIDSFVKIGMKVEWKGQRDKATNTVLTSKLEVN